MAGQFKFEELLGGITAPDPGFEGELLFGVVNRDRLTHCADRAIALLTSPLDTRNRSLARELLSATTPVWDQTTQETGIDVSDVADLADIKIASDPRYLSMEQLMIRSITADIRANGGEL